ncbi:MAG TPA: carbon-nitrogen family hydrolase [Candidatus Gastranaerophilales bacterium]|nr:carbon-nitrogen family hydrolase [Candidatus Gastranaerophilales bacterium]
MKNKVKILGIQIQPEMGNKKANLEKVKNFIAQYSWYKPDLIVLPEVFNTGVDHKALQKMAEPVPGGATTELLAGLAKKYNTNIVMGSFAEKLSDNDYKNTSAVINRQGEIIGKYHKIHLFDYHGSEESKYFSAGNNAVIVETDIGKIGLTVCFDIRFPELYRCLSYAGADIITNVAAFPYPKLDHWLTLNKARAIENLIYMVVVNQCGKVNIKRQNIGMSMVINPWGEIISCAGGDEGVMTAEIDLEKQKKIRKNFNILEDRKPECYEVCKQTTKAPSL